MLVKTVISKNQMIYIKEFMTFLTEFYIKHPFDFSFVHDSVLVSGATDDQIKIMGLQAAAFEVGFAAGLNLGRRNA